MLEFIFRWIFRFLIEFCVYLIVDHLVYESVKQTLCDSKNKRSILLLECIVLFPVCAVVRVNHTPYLLFALSCFTLLYATFQPDFRSYWEKLVTLWNECLIVEEQQKIERGEKGSVSPEVLSRIEPAVEPPGDKVYRPEGILPHGSNGAPFGRRSDGLTNGQRVGTTNAGAVPQPVNQLIRRVNTSNTGDQMYRASDTQPQPGDTNFSSCQPDDAKKADGGSAAAGVNSGPSTGNQAVCGGEGLRSRFIGTTSGADGAHSNPNNADPEKPSKMGFLATILNMFVSSSGSYDGKHPPGITNPSAVCFMNCILQALSRTPRLVEYIDDAMDDGLCNALDSQRLRFFKEVYVVFCALSKRGAQVDSSGQACFYKSAVETGGLRKAISELNDLLVVDPDSTLKQNQQDAAEFLTWFLDRLDEVLVTSSHIQTTQESLRRLRDKCNTPSPADIALKRQQCHLQISLANGRDSATYLWPASVLSDLEWLVYKEPKKSIISDVFQGQEVSALFCDACEHISLSFHQFNVILLPIPTDTDGIVRIEDCFRQAIAVSILSGPNRRQCDFCNSQTQGANPSGNAIPRTGHVDTSTPNGPLARRPDVEFLSPIPRVDHGPPAASTPFPQRPSLTDGQKQMSYRHLPDCLIVQLLRFDSSMRKILKRVQVTAGPIDLCFLDMIRIGVTVPRLYTLYGVCMHSGASDMGSGHYTSFSLADDGKWYHFSDRKVKVVANINQELRDENVQQSVYILFYRRVE